MLTACGSLAFYGQGLVGHSRLMMQRQPIDKAIERAESALREKLELIETLRQFAAAELHLPADRHYQHYVELNRDFVVWNVVAAPEFSLQPKLWCYPLIGCASYRGYFSEAAAQSYATGLAERGWDTTVGGVVAYSTLGWFNDPLLSSMLRGSNRDIAELLFHELAHQVFYFENDTDLNEAFATLVGEQGVLRWLSQVAPQQLAVYRAELKMREQFDALLNATRARLHGVYETDMGASQMSQRKREIYERLQSDYQVMKRDDWQGDARYDAWFAKPVNNARLAAVGAYRQRLPELRSKLHECDDDFERFFAYMRHSRTLPGGWDSQGECTIS